MGLGQPRYLRSNMRFLEGLFSALFLTALIFGVLYFTKEIGIKRGREIASKEMNQKLINCNKIIVGEK